MGKLNYKAVEAKLKHASGNISLAAANLGVTRKAVYDFLEKHPKLKNVVTDEREAMVDAAENALHAAILEKQSWAVTLCLKTLGKRRGYVERLEIEENPIDWDAVPEETRDAFIDGKIGLEDVQRIIRARESKGRKA